MEINNDEYITISGDILEQILSVIEIPKCVPAKIRNASLKQIKHTLAIQIENKKLKKNKLQAFINTIKQQWRNGWNFGSRIIGRSKYSTFSKRKYSSNYF